MMLTPAEGQGKEWAGVVLHLRFVHDAADQDGEAQVEQDLARLHGALLTGEYVAV